MDTDLWMWRRSGGSAPDCRPPRWPGAQEDRSQEPRAPGSGEWSPRTGDASSGAREQCGFFWGAKIFRLRAYSIHLISISISSLLFKCFPNSRFRNWTFRFHEIHFIKNPYWACDFLFKILLTMHQKQLILMGTPRIVLNRINQWVAIMNPSPRT